jgi:chromosome segregation ATPase
MVMMAKVRKNAKSTIKEHYKKQLHLQRREHEAQIDEVLEHLNSIELAFAEKLTKKDIMTEALTNSLTAYQLKNEEIKQQHEITITKLDEAKQDISAGHERYRALKAQLEQEKIQAIRIAQDEIRQAAESQFASAQKTYIKLQQDYRESCQDKENLQEQLSEMVNKVETLEAKERENDGEMSKLMSEVAYAKAAMATVQAEMLKMKQAYNEKIQGYANREKANKSKLEEADQACKDARALVEEAVKEKDEAKKENLELQTLCEELMGIVEGNAS